MGEYFDWVNVEKKEYLSPWCFHLGNKATESSVKGNLLLCALYELLSTEWHGDQVVFLGDEANSSELESFPVTERLCEQAEGEYYYDYIDENYCNASCLFQAAETEVREEIDHTNEYGIDSSESFAGLFLRAGKRYPYIVNHTKKQYYSLDAVWIVYEDGTGIDYADPLPMLMALGQSVEAGAWVGDIVEGADISPEGYQYLKVIHSEKSMRKAKIAEAADAILDENMEAFLELAK